MKRILFSLSVAVFVLAAVLSWRSLPATVHAQDKDGILFVDFSTRALEVETYTFGHLSMALKDHSDIFHGFTAKKKYLFRVDVEGKVVCEQEVGRAPVCPGIDHIVNGDKVEIIPPKQDAR